MHPICYYFCFYLNEISSLHCFICIPTDAVVIEDITITDLEFSNNLLTGLPVTTSVSLPPSVLSPPLSYPPAKQCSHIRLLLKDPNDHWLPRGWCQNSPCAYGAYLGCVCRTRLPWINNPDPSILLPCLRKPSIYPSPFGVLAPCLQLHFRLFLTSWLANAPPSI